MSGTRGFTLLELLVAVALFVLIAAMAYSGLSALIAQNEGLRERSESLKQVQMAAQMLQWDLTQMVDRPVRDPLGETLGSLVVGGRRGILNEFSRSGIALLPAVRNSALARVRYRLDDGSLIRERLQQLDSTDRSQVVGSAILDEVSSVSFEFIDKLGARHSSWPPLSATDDSVGTLPKAVEVVIEHVRWGELRRLVLVQG